MKAHVINGQQNCCLGTGGRDQVSFGRGRVERGQEGTGWILANLAYFCHQRSNTSEQGGVHFVDLCASIRRNVRVLCSLECFFCLLTHESSADPMQSKLLNCKKTGVVSCLQFRKLMMIIEYQATGLVLRPLYRQPLYMAVPV